LINFGKSKGPIKRSAGCHSEALELLCAKALLYVIFTVSPDLRHDPAIRKVEAKRGKPHDDKE